MAADMDDGSERELRRLVDHAIADFGASCLWNARTDHAVRVQAKLVYDALAKHAGRAGMRRAVAIREALAVLGERPWR